MNRKKCECGRMLVEPFGPTNAPILLVGEFPGWEEERTGIPFSGRAGDVLRQELGRVGIQMAACRLTNLYLHIKAKDCPVDKHILSLVQEMQGRKYILLMGSDVTKTLLNRSVMELSGLQVKVREAGTATCVVAPNPANVFHDTVGEFRLAVERFAKIVK